MWSDIDTDVARQYPGGAVVQHAQQQVKRDAVLDEHRLLRISHAPAAMCMDMRKDMRVNVHWVCAMRDVYEHA